MLEEVDGVAALIVIGASSSTYGSMTYSGMLALIHARLRLSVK